MGRRSFSCLLIWIWGVEFLVFDFCFCILDVAFFDFGCWVFKCCFFNFGAGFFLGFRCWVDYILDLCFLISDFGIWVRGFLSVLLDYWISGFALPKHLLCSEAKQVFSI